MKRSRRARRQRPEQALRTPWAQRLQRLQTVACGPQRSGRSRHGVPVRRM